VPDGREERERELDERLRALNDRQTDTSRFSYPLGASLETRVENLERFSTLPRVKRSRKGGSKKAGEDTREYCTSCQRWLPREAFPSNQRMRSGLSSHCRACHAEANREWRERNPDAVAAYNEARRIGPRQARCVECGASFQAGRRGPISDRCRRCRRTRRLEQRRELHRKAA
jgi:hypothetical protein